MDIALHVKLLELHCIFFHHHCFLPQVMKFDKNFLSIMLRKELTLEFSTHLIPYSDIVAAFSFSLFFEIFPPNKSVFLQFNCRKLHTFFIGNIFELKNSFYCVELVK
ncbi:Uncharacterized protein TCM_031276, partial [Theobroma cacao]